MIYLGGFESKNDILANFTDDYGVQTSYEELIEMRNDIESANILLAAYDNADYEACAFVLFHRDGKLYEVNASHCSCYGLGGQWLPEETIVKALRYRINEGNLGHGYGGINFVNELNIVLDEWKE